MSIKKLPIGKKFPNEFNAVIEIPKDSDNKYEYDEELDVMKLDRTLHSSLHYPVDYGFIPETRAEDGDHTDVIVLTSYPVFPGCVITVRPIGIMFMEDGGEIDNKIVAVPAHNPRYDAIKNLKDIRSHTRKEIAHFFEEYKALEEKHVVITGWAHKKEAIKILKKNNEVYLKETLK